MSWNDAAIERVICINRKTLRKILKKKKKNHLLLSLHIAYVNV